MDPDLIRSVFAGGAIALVAPNVAMLFLGLFVVAMGILIANVLEDN